MFATRIVKLALGGGDLGLDGLTESSKIKMLIININ